MLGAMLGCHSKCLCVPESQFLDDLLARAEVDAAVDPRIALSRISSHEQFRLLWDLALNPGKTNPAEVGTTWPEIMTWLVQDYGRKAGKVGTDLWVDQTPTNFRRARRLLRMFPTARFVHLVRDGRAVAASLLPLDWGPNDSLHAAQFWMARCALGLAAELELGETRVLRVRYEDVLQEPETSLRRIADFAGVDYEPGMAAGGGYRPTRYHERQHHLVGQPPDRSRSVGWQQALSRRQVEIFEAETGDFLETMGYRPEYGVRARPASRVEVLQLRLSDFARRVRNNLHRRWRAKTSVG